MSRPYQMRQCVVEWGEGSTVSRGVCWLPERLCRVGMILRRKEDLIGARSNEQGRVLEVFDTSLTYEYVAERSRDYRHTREASDI